MTSIKKLTKTNPCPHGCLNQTETNQLLYYVIETHVTDPRVVVMFDNITDDEKYAKLSRKLVQNCNIHYDVENIIIERNQVSKEDIDFADEIGKMLDMKYDQKNITSDNVQSFRKLISFMNENKDKI